MGKEIIIGRQGNQPFVIGDPKVSSRHASLCLDDHGRLVLIDHNSTNGTFIYNGQNFERLYPNQAYQVTEDSMIQLGPDTRFHVRRLLNPIVNGTVPPSSAGAPKLKENQAAATPKKAPKPEKVNIKGLRKVSEEYAERKMKLESKSGMVGNLRSCTILISMVVGMVGPVINSMSGEEGQKSMLPTVISIGVAVILMITLFIIIDRLNKKVIREKAENDKEYSIKYCCPKCGHSFKGKIYENILSERRCPKCKSEYYE